MGVLSALPLVNIGNACCCLWVVAGGVVAAYVLQQNQAAPISPGDGALVGLLAGLIGALVQAVVSIPLDLVVGPMERAMLQRLMDMSGNMPPDLRDVFERVGRESQNPAMFVMRRVVGLFFWLCIGGIFSTVGGVIGAAIFKKKLPPGTIDVTPTTA
jgi:hypothetical protein